MVDTRTALTFCPSCSWSHSDLVICCGVTYKCTVTETGAEHNDHTHTLVDSEWYLCMSKGREFSCTTHTLYKTMNNPCMCICLPISSYAQMHSNICTYEIISMCTYVFRFITYMRVYNIYICTVCIYIQ